MPYICGIAATFAESWRATSAVVIWRRFSKHGHLLALSDYSNLHMFPFQY
jgi:hypothetical protein